MNDTASETVTRTLRAERSAVWALISVPANIPIWYDGWDTVESDDADRPMRGGTTIRLARAHTSRAERAVCTVTVCTPETRIVWIERVAGHPDVEVDFTLGTSSTDTPATHISYTRRFV